MEIGIGKFPRKALLVIKLSCWEIGIGKFLGKSFKGSLKEICFGEVLQEIPVRKFSMEYLTVNVVLRLFWGSICVFIVVFWTNL